MSADVTNPEIPNPSLYAALYCPSQNGPAALAALAADFSPRFELHRNGLVAIDVSGLTRLIGPARTIGEELRRTAAARGVHAQVAIAGTQMAAIVLAQARPGLTIVEPGGEAAALAPIPIDILEKLDDEETQSALSTQRPGDRSPHHLRLGRLGDRSPHYLKETCPPSAVSAFKRWGLKTLGEIAAMPAADLTARLGRQGAWWQAIARGADVRPLVPALEAERFESSLELEWPIEGLEPLSFVLTRLLEPLSTRLERRDRGAAVLHVVLRLVTKELVLRSLQLPSPLRDVRTLRTLALLDLDAHPPDAAIDRVQVVIDPTPARVLQHTLFTRAHPTVEQMSTLLARLGALMGEDRIGAAALVDTYRPGAFAMTPFATDHDDQRKHSAHLDHDDQRRDHRARREDSSQFSADSASSAVNVVSDHDQRRTRGTRGETISGNSAGSASSASNVVTALRRCRQPVPARVVVAGDRPVRVTTDRGGFGGGAVLACAGPWRTSGEWWTSDKLEVKSESPLLTSGALGAGGAWNRDEWDVALADGAQYRIFRDRDRDAWFVDAIVD